MPCIRLDTLDTTPGSGAWSAPAEEVDNYTQWLRDRYRVDRTVAQYLAVVARKVGTRQTPITYLGPYADALETAINRMAQDIHPRQKENSQHLSAPR